MYTDFSTAKLLMIYKLKTVFMFWIIKQVHGHNACIFKCAHMLAQICTCIHAKLFKSGVRLCLFLCVKPIIADGWSYLPRFHFCSSHPNCLVVIASC